MSNSGNTIIIKSGVGVPEGKLLPSELGFDTEGKKLYIGHEDGVVCIGSQGSENPGGSDNPGNSGGSETNIQAVLYVEQNLEEEQKAQARANIGAVDVETVKELSSKLEDYINPFEIKSFTVSPSKAENGQKITSVTLTWSLTKTPKSLSINEEEYNLQLQDGSITYTEDDENNWDFFPIVSDKEWNFYATDEQDKEIGPKKVYTKFYNGIYYGVIDDGIEITSELINLLVSQGQITKKLQNTPTVTFTKTAGVNQRFFYALPSTGYKKPDFKDAETNLSAGMQKVEEPLNYSNQYQYLEQYDIWLSEQIGLGEMTIIVKEAN